MKQKAIQVLLIIGILIVPILFVFQEDTDLSVRYIAIIFSIITTLFSVFISSAILKFIYKIFVSFSKESIDEIQTLFLGYIFLNSLLLLALKDAGFLTFINLLNPTLIIFLSVVTIIYYGLYGKKKLLYSATAFYTTNFLFSLIGVMLNNA